MGTRRGVRMKMGVMGAIACSVIVGEGKARETGDIDVQVQVCVYGTASVSLVIQAS